MHDAPVKTSAICALPGPSEKTFSRPGNRYFLIMSPDNNTIADVILRRVFIACVIVLAIFQFSENTADPDLWGHVIYGDHLLQTSQLMRASRHSWTAAAHEWVTTKSSRKRSLWRSRFALGGPGLLLLTINSGIDNILSLRY